jgi:hypothetical protein
MVKEENPGIKFGDISKVLGAMWGRLDDEEKQVYTPVDTTDDEDNEFHQVINEVDAQTTDDEEKPKNQKPKKEKKPRKNKKQPTPVEEPIIDEEPIVDDEEPIIDDEEPIVNDEEPIVNDDIRAPVVEDPVDVIEMQNELFGDKDEEEKPKKKAHKRPAVRKAK